jgi:hypothetical protein
MVHATSAAPGDFINALATGSPQDESVRGADLWPVSSALLFTSLSRLKLFRCPHSLLPSSLYLDHSVAAATLRQLP